MTELYGTPPYLCELKISQFFFIRPSWFRFGDGQVVRRGMLWGASSLDFGLDCSVEPHDVGGLVVGCKGDACHWRAWAMIRGFLEVLWDLL